MPRSNPSSVGYARGTQVTTQLTARETFGGPAKAGLGRHIGMGQFTYGAIINGNSGSGIGGAPTLAGPSYPQVAGKTLRDDNGRIITHGPDGSFVRQATDLFGEPIYNHRGDKLFYPINFNNQIGGISNPSSRYGPTRAPADGVNSNTRMQNAKTVASWNKLNPARPMRDTPNASRPVPFPDDKPSCDCSESFSFKNEFAYNVGYVVGGLENAAAARQGSGPTSDNQPVYPAAAQNVGAENNSDSDSSSDDDTNDSTTDTDGNESTSNSSSNSTNS
jgi:hypothetical protein